MLFLKVTFVGFKGYNYTFTVKVYMIFLIVCGGILKYDTMRYFIVLFIALLCLYTTAFTQCPTNISFDTQQDVDDFALNYPGCTDIPGNVSIGGFFGGGGNVSNLYGLSQILSVGGSFQSYYAGIIDFSGLDNLTYIGGDVSISGPVTSLNGLGQLEAIGGRLYLNGTGIENMSGLSGLTSIGDDMTVNNNPYLINFDGLSNLRTIGGDVKMGYEDDLISYPPDHALSDLKGLEGLNFIGGNFYLLETYYLSDLQGLENLAYIGGELRILNNTALSLCNVEGVCRHLTANGPATISGNLLGCGSVAEVENACFGTFVSCVEEFSILNVPIPTGTFQATTNVISTGSIMGGQNVDFKAGQSILLDNNFTVSPNADFSAEIDDCN